MKMAEFSHFLTISHIVEREIFAGERQSGRRRSTALPTESGRRPVSSGLADAKRPENPVSAGFGRFRRVRISEFGIRNATRGKAGASSRTPQCARLDLGGVAGPSGLATFDCRGGK